MFLGKSKTHALTYIAYIKNTIWFENTKKNVYKKLNKQGKLFCQNLAQLID